MFEKEAEEYTKKQFSSFVKGIREIARISFKKGAEFGYNKANEWHYVKDGLPKESGRYLVSCHLPLIDKEYITTSDYSAYGYKWGVEKPDGFGDPAPKVMAWKPLPKSYKE